MKKILLIITYLFIFVNLLFCTKPEIKVEPEKPKETISIKKAIPKDRCSEYLPDIRTYALQYIGLDFPWWYQVGTAMVETSCRGDLVSFDGGIGLFQLTPSTGITSEISKYIDVDPYNTQSNIRAQAYYFNRIIKVHFMQKSMTFKSKYKINPKEFVDICGSNLADAYRFYNGGYWFFYEATRGPALACSNNEIAEFCVRSGTYVGKQYISFCQVNYSYPTKVWKYSKPYKGGSDGKWNFFYIPDDEKLTVTFPIPAK